MRKISSILIFSCLLTLVASPGTFSQNVRENVTLYLNDEKLICGETLLFSAHLTSATTGKLSELSKLLYVELVGKGGPVFQAKVSLEGGVGEGDFFIPSTIPTGTYQLLAYTRWMKNFGDYFQESITIINPFESYHSEGGPRLEVTFFPEGGHLVPDVENRVVIQVRDQYGSGAKAKGRVNLKEDKVIRFETDISGFGEFSVVPESGLQLILEDTNEQLSFYNLPDVSDIPSIRVESDQSSFRIRIIGQSKDNLKLKVHNQVSNLLDQEVIPGSVLILPFEKAGDGIVQAQLFSGEGKLISKRLIGQKPNFNEKEPVNLGYFNTRKAVTLDFTLPPCRVSVSVRKVFSSVEAQAELTGWKYGLRQTLSSTPDNPEHLLISSEYRWEGPFTKSEVEFLPELRGELLSGKLVDGEGQPVSGQPLIYSTPSGNNQTIAVSTDGYGRFTLQMKSTEEDHAGYLKIGDFESDYAAMLDPVFLTEYPRFDFWPVRLDSGLIEEVTARSIRNQVENAFYMIKKDTIKPEVDWIEGIPSFDYFYLLDDYNRFPKLEESFIEYIPTVAVRKRRSGGEFKILTGLNVPFEFPSLVTLDGVPVPDSLILGYSPYKIKSIGVINNRVFLGSQVFDGLLSFETFDGNLDDFELPNELVEIPYKGVIPKKNYFRQVHADSTSRQSDYRDQLFWDPDVQVTDKLSLHFFTSQSTGRYEIKVAGTTPGGENVTLTRVFDVIE